MCKSSLGEEGGGKIVRRKCSEGGEGDERVVRSHATVSHKEDD